MTDHSTPTSPKHLFICASWPQVVMSLAYLDSARDLSSHSFLILGDSNKSREEQEFLEIRHALAHLGHSQVAWSEARKSEYEELHLSPAYTLFSDDKKHTDSVKHKTLIVHADGLRNGVYVDPRLAPEVKGVVHYGFRLIETSTLATRLRAELLMNSHVVPFASIAKVWHKLHGIFGIRPSGGLVSKRDLLVCERYWGADTYPMLEGSDSGAHLRSVLRLTENGYRRLIFRPTHFHGSEKLRWADEVKEYAESVGVKFTIWSEVFDEGVGAKILDHPEAQFFLGNLSGLGGLYAFDGSLSLLIGALGKPIKVHWADTANTRGLFVEERLSHLVAERGKWMREVSQANVESAGKESLGDFFTDGLTYNSILAEMYLGNARAQLVEKDASLSWRITKPLRVIGNLLTARKR